jgi:hypothetical protein
MKQTAVEWLISEIKSQLIARVTELDLYSLQQQAKEMEKEQIMDAHGIKTFRTIKMGLDVYEQINGEQYYNETYK